MGTLAYGLFVRGGNVVSAEGYKIEAEDESFSEIIEQFLLQFYHDAGDMPHEINVADEPQECELSFLKNAVIPLKYVCRNAERSLSNVSLQR